MAVYTQVSFDEASALIDRLGDSARAVLPDSRTTLQGKLQFVDNAVDAASGTVRVKAEFANVDRQLVPGQFVNVRLLIETLPHVLDLGRGRSPWRQRHDAARQACHLP